jgi:chemotaxis protein CheD
MSGLPAFATERHPPATSRLIHVIQGEYAVVADPGAILTTLLGSCVAACLRDPVSGVGGMNHFLLPGDRHSPAESMKYGVNSMELLINGLLQRGAMRGQLEAKLFGGANVVQNLSDIGRKNAEFALDFLQKEGIRCVAQSLGGDRARRVRFRPSTGQASQLLLDDNEAAVLRVERPPASPVSRQPAGDVELF